MVHKKLVLNMCAHIDSRHHGILDWASYIRAMTLIKPYDLESRVDSLISTIAKWVPATSELVYEIARKEGGGIPREQ